MCLYFYTLNNEPGSSRAVTTGVVTAALGSYSLISTLTPSPIRIQLYCQIVDRKKRKTRDMRIPRANCRWDPFYLGVDPPLVTVMGSGKGVTSPAWRSDPCVASIPDATCAEPGEAQPASAGDDFTAWTAADIGGTGVDYNTQPQPVSRKQIALEISVLRRGPWDDWESYATGSTGSVVIVEPYLYFNVARLALAQHHRNRTSFLGLAYGTLLLTDTKLTRVHHSYVRVTYSLLYDEWRHARQRPKVVITNSNEGAKTVVNNISVLTDVLWFQQFLGSVDFDTGFNSAEMLILNEWGK